MKHESVTQRIIEAFYAVYNTLGYGFLERVYQQSVAWELEERGFVVIEQAPIEVIYHGRVAGEYFADLLIEHCVIVEIKAVEELSPKHEAQLLNYLKATEIEVGLLLNFGPKPQVKRKIFDARYKPQNTIHKNL